MGDVTIRVDNLGKRYRLGEVKGYRALRETLSGPVRAMLGIARRTPRPDDENTFWALRNVRFEVKRGEVVGIIGRNGAGKSTLLKVLSRIVEPTEGRCEIHGRVGSLLEVGTGFHPELTGRENVYLNGAILGMKQSEIRRKFDEIVEFAEVGRFIDTPVKRYSSGMYTRLAFSVAAHLEPDVLIVDEVLAVGDAQFQQKCMGRMNDVAKEGRTVLFVSHNMSAVRSLCSRAVWMRNGSVHREGATDAITEEFLTELLAHDGSRVSLEKLPRRYGEGRVRLTSITFNDGEPLKNGQPLRVRLEFEPNGVKENLAFGIAFSHPFGGRVMCLDTDIPPGKPVRLEADGPSAVEFEMPSLPLQPGRYTLDIAVRSFATLFGLDFVEHCAMIDVLPSETTPGLIAGTGESSVRLGVEVSHVESLSRAPASV